MGRAVSGVHAGGSTQRSAERHRASIKPCLPPGVSSASRGNSSTKNLICESSVTTEDHVSLV
jgi:hypothetical protein